MANRLTCFSRPLLAPQQNPLEFKLFKPVTQTSVQSQKMKHWMEEVNRMAGRSPQDNLCQGLRNLYRQDIQWGSVT